jgi:hypothetical protein
MKRMNKLEYFGEKERLEERKKRISDAVSGGWLLTTIGYTDKISSADIRKHDLFKVTDSFDLKKEKSLILFLAINTIEVRPFSFFLSF